MTDVPLPQVSVVLSAYNGARYLRAQLDSILAQTCADLELIALDDASSDDSLGILEEYAGRDRRVSVLRNVRNRGLIDSLGTLFARARAPWIAISDHDDLWHPQKLEKLLAAAGRAPACCAAYCNSALIDGEGQSLGLTIMEAIGVATPVHGDMPLNLLWKNCVSGHAMIFRRELCAAFLPFSPELSYDQQIAILAISRGGLAYCPEVLVQHRLHGNNFCNHSLLRNFHSASPLDNPQRVIRRRNASEKLQRRRLHRKKLADRMVFFERKDIIPPQWRRVVNSDRLDRHWFDLAMFMFVLQHPEVFIQRVHHHRLHVAFKFAKGAAWYRSVHACRLWLAQVTRA